MFLNLVIANDASGAAELKGAYPVGNWLSPNKSMQIYETNDATVVDYKIHSNFGSDIWKVVEYRYEDSTISYVSGPRGDIYSIDEGGEDWGYSNHNGLSIFFLDYFSLAGNGSDQRYSELPFRYDALVVNERGIKAYGCSFDVTRLRDSASRALLREHFKSSDVIYKRIRAFLAANGVDTKLDNCQEDPQYLNKPVADLVERDIRQRAEAAKQP